MRKSIFSAALVMSLVSTSALAQEATVEQAAEDRPNNFITVVPNLWIAFLGAPVPGGSAGFNLQYERGLTDNFTALGAFTVDIPFGAPLMPGGEVGARFYFSGTAPHGFSVGAKFAAKAAFGGLLMQPSAGINYNALWGSGFTMNVGIGVGYTLATAGGVIPLKGLTIPMHFGLGWAF